MTKFKHIPYIEIHYDGTGFPQNGFTGIFIVHETNHTEMILVETVPPNSAYDKAAVRDIRDVSKLSEFWLNVYKHYNDLGDILAAKEAMTYVLGQNNA